MLLDAAGNPTAPTQQQMIQMLLQERMNQQVFLQELQKAMMFLEMKCNFLVLKCKDKGVLNDIDLSTDWETYQKERLEEIRATKEKFAKEQEAQVNI